MKLADPANIAKKAVLLLDSKSRQRILDFIRNQQNADGGFRGRMQASDLYYTLFGLNSLMALGAAPPAERMREYLLSIEASALDLIHLHCLIRCLESLPASRASEKHCSRARSRLMGYRSPMGGFTMTRHGEVASIYATFLAVHALRKRSTIQQARRGVRHCLEKRRTADGAFADQPGLTTGTTTVTAAAVILMSAFQEDIPASVRTWLAAQQHQGGGFRATPGAPIPDLLSTSAALSALSALDAPLDSYITPTLNFIETVWHEEGGFTASLADTVPDCEYTFYGLLSLGHLADCHNDRK